MGGEAFKGLDGQHLTTPITKSEVSPTLNRFYQILKGVGVQDLVPLGSTGKKEISGDIDVAIGPFAPEELKQKKAEIVSYLKQELGDDKAKLLGQNIAVMFEISGRENEYVQIDVMLSLSPTDTGELMSGTGVGVKGVYRNLLLAYIAKLRSTDDAKITISFPGGVQVARGKEILIPRTEKLKEILGILGIDSVTDVSTFENLVEYVATNPELSNSLYGFKEYIQRYLDDPKTAKDANLAISVIENKTGRMQESRLRQIIKLLLN